MGSHAEVNKLALLIGRNGRLYLLDQLDFVILAPFFKKFYCLFFGELVARNDQVSFYDFGHLCFDLLKVFQDILARHKEEALLEIEREEISMAEMLERLRNMVLSSGELNLRLFFERAKSRRELVLAFLSVLELVRTTEVKLFQRETFGDIVARVTN